MRKERRGGRRSLKREKEAFRGTMRVRSGPGTTYFEGLLLAEKMIITPHTQCAMCVRNKLTIEEGGESKTRISLALACTPYKRFNYQIYNTMPEFALIT